MLPAAHRAIVWGVQSHYYMDLLVWMLNCWGIVPLTDMLSMDNTEMIAEVDTPENREQAIYDIAMLTERMIMRNRTHGGYKVLLDDLWKFVEEFNADMVILWEYMSCKALDSMRPAASFTLTAGLILSLSYFTVSRRACGCRRPC